MSTRHDRKAEAFHQANPHVMAKLREIALKVKASGKRSFGIAALFERLRWVSQFETKDDTFKLNNSYRAWFARQLMQQDSELRGFFEIRESAQEAERTRVRRHFRRKKGAPSSPPVSPVLSERLF